MTTNLGWAPILCPPYLVVLKTKIPGIFVCDDFEINAEQKMSFIQKQSFVGRDVVVHPADNEFGQFLCYRINVFIKKCCGHPHELRSQDRQLDRTLQLKVRNNLS